jgi:hypothetical protein
MNRIWKRLVIIISLGWFTATFLFIWFAAQGHGKNIALALYRMIKQAVLTTN